MHNIFHLYIEFSIFIFGEIHFFSENNIFVSVVAGPSAPSAAAGSAPPPVLLLPCELF